jgi:hypothetical protein
VLVVVNLDPHGARETTVRLDMPALGLEWDDTMAVHDEIAATLRLGPGQLRAARPVPRAGARLPVERRALHEVARSSERTSPRPTAATPSVAIDNFADLPDEQRDPHWYKRAVFYEVLVRSFKDSNGDGTGDLPA